LAAALQRGYPLSARYDGDSPLVFPDKLRVTNFAGTRYGRIDLLNATVVSANTVYAALNRDIGPWQTVDAAVDAGIPEGTPGVFPEVGNVLGTASPRVIDLARAYATFAAQGQHSETYMVRSVFRADGTAGWQTAVRRRQVFNPVVSRDVTYVLQETARRSIGADAAGRLDRPVAGTIGRTLTDKAAWFTGYTPQLACAVGLYRLTSGRSAPLTGLGGRGQRVTSVSFPVRIWAAFMESTLRQQPVLDFPRSAWEKQLRPRPRR
ncbi:MAG: transglycosylase domain-containing protein, partial [Phycicoccus sp.]